VTATVDPTDRCLANHEVLLTRTAPKAAGAKSTEGIIAEVRTARVI
jgi:hypothetical protein